ncbi:MAG: HAD family hydrolase [Patescibacteria group bacterium]|jgi:phosphoserine phosphatase
MKIVFDLDYTLLDTAKFKEALAEAYTSQGVSRERYEETYRAVVKREGKVYDYDPEVQLKMLGADLGGPEAVAEVRRRIGDVLASTEKYLYPGSRELLAELRRHGGKLALMTLGNEKWQRAKIEHSGLADLFDEVVATEDKKVGVVRSLAEGGEPVIVVNDNGAEMREMMAVAPEFKYVLKCGPKSVPEDLKLPEGKDIAGVASALAAETGWEIDLERRAENTPESAEEFGVPGDGEVSAERRSVIKF